MMSVHTLAEAAEMLRVKPSWLERRAAARRIPFTMLGGSYRFTDDHIAAIVQQHEKRPELADATAPAQRAKVQPMRRPRPGDLQSRPLRPRPRRAA